MPLPLEAFLRRDLLSPDFRDETDPVAIEEDGGVEEEQVCVFARCDEAFGDKLLDDTVIGRAAWRGQAVLHERVRDRTLVDEYLIAIADAQFSDALIRTVTIRNADGDRSKKRSSSATKSFTKGSESTVVIRRIWAIAILSSPTVTAAGPSV